MHWVPAFAGMTFVVRATAAPTSLIARIREEVGALDRDVPVASLTTLDTWVTKSMAPTRFLLALNGTFAGLALVLASLLVASPEQAAYQLVRPLVLFGQPVRSRARETGVPAAGDPIDPGTLGADTAPPPWRRPPA